MIPILYKEDETNFETQGICQLIDSKECKVTEQRNGAFTLKLEYPANGFGYQFLDKNYLIKARPNDLDDPHVFRINYVEQVLETAMYSIQASSITDDMAGTYIKDLVISELNGQEALNSMKEHLVEETPFGLWSDIQYRGSTEWHDSNILNLLVGTDGSFVDIWGGEIKRRNDGIYIYAKRGRENITTIRSGRNINGFKMTTSFVGKYTRMIPRVVVTLDDKPFGKEAESLEGQSEPIKIYGEKVISDLDASYPARVRRMTGIDLSQNDEMAEFLEEITKELQDWRQQKDETLRGENGEENTGAAHRANVELSQKMIDIKGRIKVKLDEIASKYFTHLNPEADVPSVTVDIDMIQISSSTEWVLFKNLEIINVCDKPTIYIPEFGIDVMLTVNEMEYDSLYEEVVSFTAGNEMQTSLTDSIRSEYKDLRQKQEQSEVNMKEMKDGLVQIIQDNSKKNGRIFRGAEEPPGDNFSKKDIWFKDVPEGKTEIWFWDGLMWVRKIYDNMEEDIQKQYEEIVKRVESKFKEFDLEELLGENTSILDDLRKTQRDIDLIKASYDMSMELIGHDGQTRYNKNILKENITRYKEFAESISMTANGDGFVKGQEYTVSWLEECIPFKDRTITFHQENMKPSVLNVIPSVNLSSYGNHITGDRNRVEIYDRKYEFLLESPWYIDKRFVVERGEEDATVEMNLEYPKLAGHISDEPPKITNVRYSHNPKVIFRGKR